MNKEAFASFAAEGTIALGRYRPGQKWVNPVASMKPYEGQIDVSRGVHRNLLGFYPVMNVDTLVAWCIGDKDILHERLVESGGEDNGFLTHIGARRRQGHGRIESVEIVEDEAALENWKVRVRPWAMLEDDVPLEAAWNPPYAASENRGSGYCPLRLV